MHLCDAIAIQLIDWKSKSEKGKEQKKRENKEEMS